MQSQDQAGRDLPRLRAALAGMMALAFMLGLAAAAWGMGLVSVNLATLLGFGIPLACAVLIARALATSRIVAPYRRLAQLATQSRSREQMFAGIVEALPMGVARLDRAKDQRYANKAWPPALGTAATRELHLAVERALLGRVAEVVVSDQQPGLKRKLGITLLPEFDAAGAVHGALAICQDRTEQERTTSDLLRTTQDLIELRAALDAHAIVTVTDSRGVIIRVNEKFCALSKYERGELIGQTHQIINSGYHPSSFFEAMWHTISAGRVWHGEICNRAKDGSLYWVSTTIVPFGTENGRPRQFVSIRADITQRKLAELRMEKMAYEDALTGLPNRRFFSDRLLQQVSLNQRTDSYSALLLIDLDHFKEINDSKGHAVGDELLVQTSRRLAHALRRCDTVARLGGDEFVVLVGNLASGRDAAHLAAGSLGAKLLAELGKPYALSGDQLQATGSIGVVIFKDDSGAQVDELLKQADIALYQAKDGGRNKLCYFDPDAQADFDRMLALKTDLLAALERSQLRAYYQPIVDADRKVASFEALLRWQHPTRGLVAPADFIPLAESTGCIVEIGTWVLDQVCQELAQWAEDPERSSWRCAVNVSARQFKHPDFVASLRALMARHKVRPEHLKLEITESTLLGDLEDTIAKMQELRAEGLQFAIDDFGTGFSSLSYLRRLPVNVLKIDRSFVAGVASDASDAAIARTVIGLAHNLGLDVVAEGVETEAQFAWLREAGCPYFQGWLFGQARPMQASHSGLRANSRSPTMGFTTAA